MFVLIKTRHSISCRVYRGERYFTAYGVGYDDQFYISCYGGLVNVITTIDATKMFADEKEQRKACGGDFCDQALKTSIEVSEKTQKQ